MEIQITTQGGLSVREYFKKHPALKEASIAVLVALILLLVILYWTAPVDKALPWAYIADPDTGNYVNQTVYGGVEFYRADLDEVSSASSLFGLSNFAQPRAGWVYVAHDLGDMALFIQKRDRIWRDAPNQLDVVRFSLDEVAENAAELSFSDGEAVSWTQDGNYYLMRPVADSVYVARSYWDEGWVEFIWTVLSANEKIIPA